MAGIIFNQTWTKPENVEQLRGAIAQSIPKWLREKFTILLPVYNRTMRLMDSKGAIRRDLMGSYAFPIDHLLRRSVEMGESAFENTYTNFEPNNMPGLRGIAAIAKEENEANVVRFQPMQRKLETALDWYTQDVTLSDPKMLIEQVRLRMNRLVEGHAVEINEMLWNFSTLANGGQFESDNLTAGINQSEDGYSIPFLVNAPRFVRIVTNTTDAAGNRTLLKALAPGNLRFPASTQPALGFFSVDTTMARRQDVGGLRRGHMVWSGDEFAGPEPSFANQNYAYWNVPMRSFYLSRSPRRLDHFISGLEVFNPADVSASGAAGAGIAGTAITTPDKVRVSSLSHLRLVELYNNLLAEDVELPDVLVTHPHVLAWMENQAWTIRRYMEPMKQVFGMNIAFFLDVPILVDPLVTPVTHNAPLTFADNVSVPAGTPFYHLYFLRFGEKGIEMMLNKKRDVKPWDVPVTSDYYMGVYYWQLFINTPMTVGAALNFRLS